MALSLAQRGDLVLAMGTSLSGFNVDSVAEKASEKAARAEGHGLVIVNLQRTPYDNGCSLRIFAKVRLNSHRPISRKYLHADL